MVSQSVSSDLLGLLPRPCTKIASCTGNKIRAGLFANCPWKPSQSDFQGVGRRALHLEIRGKLETVPIPMVGAVFGIRPATPAVYGGAIGQPGA